MIVIQLESLKIVGISKHKNENINLSTISLLSLFMRTYSNFLLGYSSLDKYQMQR